MESEVWINDDDNEDFADTQPVFTLSQIHEEDQLINLMNNNDSSSYCEQDQSFQEQCNIEYFSS